MGARTSPPAPDAVTSYSKHMGTAALVSVDEYLRTSYSPGHEYLDGLILERHLGELTHSDARRKLIRILAHRPAETSRLHLRW
jgi:hypothetical protein